MLLFRITLGIKRQILQRDIFSILINVYWSIWEGREENTLDWLRGHHFGRAYSIRITWFPAM